MTSARDTGGALGAAASTDGEHTMQHEAARDDVQLFANAVEHLGFRRNVSTGRTIPLPPDADNTVATYKHRDTGRLVCVWPVMIEEQAAELGTLADRHGFTFVQFGRPQPREDAEHLRYNDRCAAGHRRQPGGVCPVCAAPRTDVCNGGQVARRTPVRQHALEQAHRLRELVARLESDEAVASACGDHEAANAHRRDAEAVALGAAVVERKALEAGDE